MKKLCKFTFTYKILCYYICVDVDPFSYQRTAINVFFSQNTALT